MEGVDDVGAEGHRRLVGRRAGLDERSQRPRLPEQVGDLDGHVAGRRGGGGQSGDGRHG